MDVSNSWAVVADVLATLDSVDTAIVALRRSEKVALVALTE